MPQWNKQTGKWEGAGSYLSLSNSLGGILLTPVERDDWQRLTAWWLAWTPPVEPYDLHPAIRVVDPARHHAYYTARIREGCTGQVQRGVLAMLRRHWRLFGGTA